MIAVTILDNCIKYTVPQTLLWGLWKSIKGFVLCGFSARLAQELELQESRNLLSLTLTGIDTNST